MGSSFWVYEILCLGSIAPGITIIPDTKGKTQEGNENFCFPGNQLALTV